MELKQQRSREPASEGGRREKGGLHGEGGKSIKKARELEGALNGLD